MSGRSGRAVDIARLYQRLRHAPGRRTLPGVTVLCASCGASVDEADACTACGEPTRLDGRYRLLSIVGQGAAGVTYRGEVCEDGAPVAVKEMPLRHTVDAKSRERMAREARVLRQLDHPQVPAYVDHFEVGSGKQRAFYLVQAFIEGKTLADEMEDRRYTEAEVVEILEELLDVLGYMHGLQPPVVHRDLKPRNVIRRASDGKLVLIDFGAVRDVLKDPALGGSTVAGTYGFMAPEQFRGDATPATDLYALGVLAVVLLSRKDPIDLVRPDHSLDWKGHVHASDGLKQAIDQLLTLDPKMRPQRAADVLKSLRARPSKPATQKPVPASETTELAVRDPYLHRGMATAMAFITGLFGGHNFYLGRKGRGGALAHVLLDAHPDVPEPRGRYPLRRHDAARLRPRVQPGLADRQGRARRLRRRVRRSAPAGEAARRDHGGGLRGAGQGVPAPHRWPQARAAPARHGRTQQAGRLQAPSP